MTLWANKVYMDQYPNDVCYMRIAGADLHYCWARHARSGVPHYYPAGPEDVRQVARRPTLTRLFALVYSLEFRVNLESARAH